MMPRKALFLILLTAVLSVLVSTAAGQVTVTEETLVIPTYLVDPPNLMPRFYEGGSHQGVQRRIYPYPMDDGLTRVKEDRTYPVIDLENPYIKIGVMPGLGARIFYAVDKTNNYDFFYRQHVIKPSLIGMVGYWVSGGNAWGSPHHHGPNTVRPMDYRIEKKPDGSVTVWMQDFDLRHRMQVLVGYTVFPDSNLVEMSIQPFNRSPQVHSFLFWANPSVHVDENYQVIFPPSVKYVTQHSKREMTSWPIADRFYNRYEYKGVDISWWKNIGVPSSFFSWDPQEDYFGGYDHGKQAGVAWIGNHFTCPGMKFWAWGNNPGGDRANQELTDEDGHYIELMAGAWTDNQPDYSWIQPFESKSAKMTWFPVRNLGGLKYANVNGALNLEVANGRAKLAINTTAGHEAAKVSFRIKEHVALEETIDIGPDKPWSREVSIPGGTVPQDLKLSLGTAEDAELLSYQPAPAGDDPMPEALAVPPAPKEIASVEELYLTGLRLDQFYNASIDPHPYYQEALKRDPGHYGVNTQLGILFLKRHLWTEAEEKLRTAVARITRGYTRARDSEAQYYLGLVLRAQGRDTEAYKHFYDATWNAGWHTAAYHNLAEIDCSRGNFETALEHIDRAVSTNTGNLKALNLRAIILRKLGRQGEAEIQAGLVAKANLLDHQSRNELYLLESAAGMKDQAKEIGQGLRLLMRDEVQSYLELAVDYANCGFYEEAIEVLARIEKIGTRFPMVYYYLGYYWAQKGDSAKSLAYYKQAARMPADYCFPFRGESIKVLKQASVVNPADARAPYYLGNLLFEHQPAQAIAQWEKARALDGDFYIVHRNLGWAYDNMERNTAKAEASYRAALACTSQDSRLFYELDRILKKAKVPPEQRYEVLKQNRTVAARRPQTHLRLAMAAVEVGSYDEALDILNNNFFPQWEGEQTYQTAFFDAYLLRGMKRYSSGQYESALDDFIAPVEKFPLERWGRERRAQFFYLQGMTHEAMGNSTQADELYRECLEVRVQRSEYLFYQALAWQKLGEEAKAGQALDQLEAMSRGGAGADFFRDFEAGSAGDEQMAQNRYLAGLAYLGRKNPEKARPEFVEALKLNPAHVWARFRLGEQGN
jgi:tetratricopeptide (TPR) repeat protein